MVNRLASFNAAMQVLQKSRDGASVSADLAAAGKTNIGGEGFLRRACLRIRQAILAALSPSSHGCRPASSRTGKPPCVWESGHAPRGLLD